MFRMRTRLRFAVGNWFNSTAYKADGVLPTLNLDFANNRYAVNGSAKTFGDIFTFTRGSTGTYFDASGNMQTAAINTPRFDYDPVTLAAKGLLIEDQRTNLVQYSKNPQNAAWVVSGGTKTNTTGTMVGYFVNPVIVASAGFDWHRLLSANISWTASTVYSWKAFVAAGQGGKIRIAMRDNFAATESRVAGNVGSTLTVDTTAAGAITHTSVVAVNGGYIHSGTFTPNATATGTFGIGPYSSVSGDSIKIYGAQFEAGTFPTSFIETSGGSATRYIDGCENTSSNISTFGSWYNQASGCFFGDVSWVSGSGSSYPMFVRVDDGTTSNRWNSSLYMGGPTLIVDGYVSGVSQGNFPKSVASSGTAKIAYSEALNNANAAFDGVIGTLDTSWATPTVTKLILGQSSGAARWFKSARYYNFRVTDSELARIST